MKAGSGGTGDLFADDSEAKNTLADNRLREPLSDVFARVAPAWKPVTDAFLATSEGQSLVHYVDARVADGAVVYPGHVFRALDLTAPQDVRVVIVGQDPYHGPGQAQGLAFSVGNGQKLPPSLRNMLKEVQADTGTPSHCSGDLSAWARQGVLLLNTSLTVEDGQPQSHAGRGWESLTDALLAHVACGMRPVIFLLWGASAQRKRAFLDKPPHRVLTANHPSPLSALRPPEPFIGCKHFSRANSLLAELRPGSAPIRW
jgi:uracil-DNA glycosylase